MDVTKEEEQMLKLELNTAKTDSAEGGTQTFTCSAVQLLSQLALPFVHGGSGSEESEFQHSFIELPAPAGEDGASPDHTAPGGATLKLSTIRQKSEEEEAVEGTQFPLMGVRIHGAGQLQELLETLPAKLVSGGADGAESAGPFIYYRAFWDGYECDAPALNGHVASGGGDSVEWGGAAVIRQPAAAAVAMSSATESMGGCRSLRIELWSSWQSPEPLQQQPGSPKSPKSPTKNARAKTKVGAADTLLGVVTMEASNIGAGEESGGHLLAALPSAFATDRVAMRELLQTQAEQPQAADLQMRRAYGHLKVMMRVKQQPKAVEVADAKEAAEIEVEDEGDGIPCDVSVFAELSGEGRLRVEAKANSEGGIFVASLPASMVGGPKSNIGMFELLSVGDEALVALCKQLQLPPDAGGLKPPPLFQTDPLAVALARGQAMAGVGRGHDGGNTMVMQWALSVGDDTPFVSYHKEHHTVGNVEAGSSSTASRSVRSFVGMVKDTIEGSLFEAMALRERLEGNCRVGMEVVRGPHWAELADARGYASAHRAEWEAREDEDGGARTVGTVLAYTICAPVSDGDDSSAVVLTQGDSEDQKMMKEEKDRAIVALQEYQEVERVNLARDQEEEEVALKGMQARKHFDRHFGSCFALVRWGEDEDSPLGVYSIGHRGRFHLAISSSSESYQSILEQLKLTDTTATAGLDDDGSAMLQRQRQLSKMLLPVAGVGCYGQPRSMDPKLLEANSKDPYSTPLSPTNHHTPLSPSGRVKYRGLPKGWKVDKRPGKRGAFGAEESERYYIHNGEPTSPSKGRAGGNRHGKKGRGGRSKNCELGCCVGAAVECGLGEVPASIIMYYPHGCELTKGYLLGTLVKCVPELVQSASRGWNYNRLRKIVHNMVDSTVLVRIVSSDSSTGEDLVDPKLVGKEGWLLKYPQWKGFISGKGYEIRLKSPAPIDPLAAATGGSNEPEDDGNGKRIFVLGKHLLLLRAGAGAGAGAMGAGAAGCAVSLPIGTGLFSLAKAEIFADLLRANGIEAIAASQFSQGREAEQGRMAAAARASLGFIVSVCNRALKAQPSSSSSSSGHVSEAWRREGVSSRRWQLWRTILLDALRSSKAQKGAGHRSAAVVETALGEVRRQLLRHEEEEHQRAMKEMQEQQRRKEAGGAGGAGRGGGRRRMKKTIESLRSEERELRMWEEGVMQPGGGCSGGGSCGCSGGCTQAGVTQGVSVCGSGRCGYQENQRARMARKRGARMARAHEMVEAKMELQIEQEEKQRRERKKKSAEETAKTKQLRLKERVDEEKKRAGEKEKEEKRRRQWLKLAGGGEEEGVSYPDRWFDRFGDKRVHRGCTMAGMGNGMPAWDGDDDQPHAPHAHERGGHGFHSDGDDGHEAHGAEFEWAGSAANDAGGMFGGMDDMLRMLD
jgi:hypothetical protein